MYIAGEGDRAGAGAEEGGAGPANRGDHARGVRHPPFAGPYKTFTATYKTVNAYKTVI